ncbi:MAG: glucosyl-3-phosphoglycerate synthase [Acidimicrobiales bacterium]
MAAPTIRTFHHGEFASDELLAAKGDTTISVCLPARNEQDTVGDIVATLHDELVVACPLIDELVVLDDQSIDETATLAAEAGATVVSSSDVLAHLAKGPGKGQAMWKSLHVTTGDLVVWCDADIRQFDSRFVTGIVGPLLAREDIGFVKGFYERPLADSGTGGGRVTELMARPLISLLFPHLSELVQPLAGEYGGRRELLESVPFVSGYGVELGLLVDLADRYGVGCLGQVDLGVRIHRNRTLDDLGPQAAAILHTALRRSAPELADPDATLVRPGSGPTPLDVDELPPLAQARDRDESQV